ncbi:biotin-dependent carboxyltransferase family protein [Flavobacteriaceae bacterium TK19130]|nr:biotin-dependent carboxyltransferase family protein [Thermobacterium salinum]
MVEVVHRGMYSTIQDLGRFGYRNLGVPLSGAMDRISATLANRILNNSDEDAVMEITLMGPKLRFQEDAIIAIVGADLHPKVNDESIEMNMMVSISKGDLLSFGKASVGTRAYIAVAGGWQTPLVLGSRSMYNGITEASAMEKGDLLALKEQSKNIHTTQSSLQLDASHFNTRKISVSEGPEWQQLSTSLQQKILKGNFSVSPQSNRMAYRLEGVEDINGSEIITAPVQPGTVQLTPSGDCIVLMRDAQTTGGYSRILQLSEQAICELAQKRGGANVQFELT